MTEQERLLAAIDDFDSCIMTTFTADGTPHGRPMHIAERDGATLWFVTGKDSAKVAEMRAGDPVVLTFQSSTTWVAATGEATVSGDRGRARQLWSAPMRAWFPDGPDDPALVAVAVRIRSAEYWAVSGTNLVTFAYGMAKSILTRQPIDADKEGEHGDVRL